MKLNSKVNNINISDNQLFEKLNIIENFKKIMPENISKFEIIDTETLIFSLKGMPAIKLVIGEKPTPSSIVLNSSESKISFSLTAHIKKIDDYLLNKLSNEEKLAFEKEIENNDALKKEVEKPAPKKRGRKPGITRKV